MSIFVVVVFLCFCVSFFLSSFMFVCASLSGQFPSHQLTLSQLLSLSSLTQQNAFRFSTLELDYTLPKEKEKNGIAASADPPRRSKKARTQPKSELSALPPPPPPTASLPWLCFVYCDCRLCRHAQGHIVLADMTGRCRQSMLVLLTT